MANTLTNQTSFERRIVNTALELSSLAGDKNTFVMVAELGTMYKYVEKGSSYVIDDEKVIATAKGGDTRWVGIAGEHSTGGGANLEEYIYITEADFTGNTFQIPDAVGQTYVVTINPAGSYSIVLPTNVGKEGRRIYIYSKYLEEELVIKNIDGDIIQTLIGDNGVHLTLVATTLVSPKWACVLTQWVQGDYLKTRRLVVTQSSGSFDEGFGEHLVVKGSIMLPAANKTSSHILDTSDFAINFNNSVAATATLPSTSMGGRIYFIKKYSDNDAAVTVTRGGSYLIDGIYTSVQLRKRNDYIMLQAFNGNRWQVISSNLEEFNTARVRSVTGATTILPQDGTIRCSNTTSAILQLPARSTMPAGRPINIYRVSTGLVTIERVGTDLIQGSTTKTLLLQWDSISIVNSGTEWVVLSQENTFKPNSFNPVLTPVANVAADGANPVILSRVGNVVTVSGRLLLGCVDPGLATTERMTLPIATVFTNTIQLSGIINQANTNKSGYLESNLGTNQAMITIPTMADTTVREWQYTYQYYIL